MSGTGNDDDGRLEVRIPRMATYDDRVDRHSFLQDTPLDKTLGKSKGGYGTPVVKDWFLCALELRTAMSAGVSFIEALALVGQNTSSRTVRRVLQRILILLREGMTLEKALGQCKDMPPLMRSLLLSGMRGGTAVTALDHIVNHYEWVLEMRGRILRVIVYPASLVVLGACVMVARDSIIAGMKGQMSASDAMVHFGVQYFAPIVAGAVAALILAWVVYIPPIRPLFDRVVLTAPLIGKMVHGYVTATFLRVLAVLIEAGMPITSAWVLAAESAGNQRVADKLMSGLRFLQDGESVQEALRITGVVKTEALGMVRAGEAAGNVPHLLRKYAEYAEQKLKTLFRGLSSMIAPFCLGGIVLGYFVNAWWLGVMAFLLMLARRLV